MPEFNADEIFEMAVNIETNGERFYRRASQEARDTRTAELLADLAGWEVRHREIFEALRRDFAAGHAELMPNDPDFEYETYFRSVTSGKVFHPEDAEKAAAGEPRDVFNFALAREKESILFYSGMKETVVRELGRERIDDIIREEMNHVAILTKELDKLENP